MYGVKRAGLPAAITKRGENFKRSQQHVNLHIRAVCNVKVLLLRVPRQSYIEGRSVAKSIFRDDRLFDICPISLEYLDAIIGAVTDVKQSIV